MWVRQVSHSYHFFIIHCSRFSFYINIMFDHLLWSFCLVLFYFWLIQLLELLFILIMCDIINNGFRTFIALAISIVKFFKLTCSYLVVLIFYFICLLLFFSQPMLASSASAYDIDLRLSHSGGDFTNFLMWSLSLGKSKFRTLCEFFFWWTFFPKLLIVLET